MQVNRFHSVRDCTNCCVTNLQVYFDHYNNKYARNGERERLEWEEFDDVVTKFKRKHIYRTIVETECKEMPYLFPSLY